MHTEGNNLDYVDFKFQIANLQKEAKAIHLYMNQLHWFYELLQYKPPTMDPDAYRQRFEDDKVFKVFSGLGLDYECFVVKFCIKFL